MNCVPSNDCPHCGSTRTNILSLIFSGFTDEMGRTKIPHRVKAMLTLVGVWEDELWADIPSKWDRHGDLIIVDRKYFTNPKWNKIGGKAWPIISSCYHAERIARNTGPVADDGFRTPSVEFLYNPDNVNFITKKENGILYRWNPTKSMFSNGNINEKIRIGKFNCKGQTVVDMFAGIGYFTLSYLIHAKAERVFAIEWNPAALEYLQHNLVANNVEAGRCVVLEGDCSKITPLGVADHVNLGLIPSCETYWLAAVKALNRERGGLLHIHGNVDIPKPGETEIQPEQNIPKVLDAKANVLFADRFYSPEECARLVAWTESTRDSIQKIVNEVFGPGCVVRIDFWRRVKVYAPYVYHMVVDIEVRRGEKKTDRSIVDQNGDSMSYVML